MTTSVTTAAGIHAVARPASTSSNARRAAGRIFAGVVRFQSSACVSTT
jgi:hypothetical protein